MDVRLHLPEPNVERAGDLLVTHLLEVKQHQRHALMVGQPLQRGLEPLLRFGGLERRQRRRGRIDDGVNGTGPVRPTGRRSLAATAVR